MLVGVVGEPAEEQVGVRLLLRLFVVDDESVPQGLDVRVAELEVTNTAI